ncbi:conserved hypothetical protein [Mesorhizobium prunaredense]|uniref:CBS domain-containing protein n=1 Tax=Mesorhizobium prunaredense TaxID=1631249 RepID=A0A1R3UYR2_9HYPH|nr:CBS domain-containing protein [Mesorhizobium prunaredense]SIT52780.1 conserved hypothetical protein [Mesorhizobium prunaredense]
MRNRQEITRPDNGASDKASFRAYGIDGALSSLDKFVLSQLKKANEGVESVSPDDPLRKAVTLMKLKGYSQLPVMTSVRELKGVISWEAIAWGKGGGKIDGDCVRDYMDREVKYANGNTHLFDAIPRIVRDGYLVVRDPKDRRVTGIVTASDISNEFLTLTGPFLLIANIENHLRELIAEKYSVDDFASVVHPGVARPKKLASELSFGEYVGLIESADRWDKLGVDIDRETFCIHLKMVNQIRNKVMHFNPQGISREEINDLRKFSNFIEFLSHNNR